MDKKEIKMEGRSLLSNEHRADFDQNGITIIKQFFDVEKEIFPIQRAIYQIIGLVMQRHGVSIKRQPFDGNNFDNGYAELIKENRKYGSEIYDLVKQIPAFIRLISSTRSEQLFCELRGTDLAGIGAASYGIRIDNPFEEQFRSQWHQDFLFQPQSMDGIVVWTPLVPVVPDMGPMIVCLESHKDGLCTYSKSKSYEQKTGAYKIGMQNDNEVAARYKQVAPLTVPGDLIVMDYLTIHQSGVNVSNRSRWSIQSRFFNFCDPTGMRIGWKSSVTAGTDIETIFTEYFAETKE